MLYRLRIKMLKVRRYQKNICIFAPKIYDIDCIEQDMECAIQPSKSQKELLETYKKTMRMI